MKKNKDKKFIRVVEWDERPNVIFIIFFYCYLLILDLSLIFSTIKLLPYEYFLSGVGNMLLLIFILINVGNGRKVYYREMEE